MYDGVRTSGEIHAMRMDDVFWSRQRVLVKAVELMILCSMVSSGKSSPDGLLKTHREFLEEVYPDRKTERENAEINMMDKVKSMPKSIEVRPRKNRL